MHAMQGSSGAKRRRHSAGAHRRARDQAIDLNAMSKRELVALVTELQARAKASPPICGLEASPEAAPSETSGEISEPARASAPTCLYVTESIRSGQTIEFSDGDVIVIGSVGSGAEIVAGGSIHIYGTLRGRALAGTAGNPTARIFCQSLQAELLSINGRYRVAENFDVTLWGRPIQARLEGTGMTLAPLD